MILVIGLLIWIIRIFVLLVFIRVLLGWISPYPRNSVMRFFWVVTEPVLAPIRRTLPYVGGFDLSPLVVWLAAIVLTSVLQSFAA